MKKKKNRQILLNIALGVLALLMVYPFLLLLSVSFSSEDSIRQYGYHLIPDEYSLEAYRYLFKNPLSLINAYKTTIIFSVIGTVGTVFLCALCAYPLTKKEYKPRKYINFFLYFTMLFSGGMVPSYIMNTQVWHLGNTIWIYILPTLVQAYNVFILRTFISGLPEEMYESARIDGVGEYHYFLKFALPLSKPALATIALTVLLAKWQDWYTSLLYITRQDLRSLQYLLQEILQNLELLRNDPNNVQFLTAEEMPSETVRMAMVVLVSGPALFVFPFFQKYLVKGLTLGSIKG